MRDRLRAGLWLVGSLGVLGGLSQWNQAPGGRANSVGPAPGWTETWEQDTLRKARRVRKELGRGPAIEVYSRVAEDPRTPASVRAEASFRWAELLRAEGELEVALELFGELARAKPTSSFGNRARMECASILRRLGRRSEACEHWLALWIDAEVEDSLRARAGRALGEAHAEAEEWDAALRILGAVAGQSLDPMEQVRAYDSIARLWLERGDLEAAAGVLHSADVALAGLAAERTALGTRIRKALSNMGSVRALKEAIAQRSGATLRRNERTRTGR